MDQLRLRPLRDDDEAVALRAHAELAADGFDFLLDHDPAVPWPRYVATMRGYRHGVGLPPDRVPAALLLAQVGADVVGRVSIRFELNDFLRVLGGHIGYGVRPAFRRRGHASEILRQSLVVLRAEGVESALVTCDEDNAGSAAVILGQGGVEAEPARADGAILKRRFWID